MLMFAKQRVMEAGLPGQVMNMYPDQSTDRLTQRMKRNPLRSPQAATTSTSTTIDETSTLIANKMQYARRILPNERRMEAVKRKMREQTSCVIVKQRGGSRFKEEKREKNLYVEGGSRSSQRLTQWSEMYQVMSTAFAL